MSVEGMEVLTRNAQAKYRQLRITYYSITELVSLPYDLPYRAIVHFLKRKREII
jgi:hypothetical protein